MEYCWELRSKNAQNIKALMCPLYGQPGAYEAGVGRPPGLKKSGQTLFSGQAQVAQKS